MRTLILTALLMVTLAACGKPAVDPETDMTYATQCGIPARVDGAPNGRINISLRYALDFPRTQGCCVTKDFDAADVGELLYSLSACQITVKADAYFVDCWLITSDHNRPTGTTDDCQWNP